jgi:hypothetical protein
MMRLQTRVLPINGEYLNHTGQRHLGACGPACQFIIDRIYQPLARTTLREVDALVGRAAFAGEMGSNLSGDREETDQSASRTSGQ